MGPEFTPSLIENQLSSHGMVASPNWIGSGWESLFSLASAHVGKRGKRLVFLSDLVRRTHRGCQGLVWTLAATPCTSSRPTDRESER